MIRSLKKKMKKLIKELNAQFVESVKLEKEVRKSLGILNYVEWLDRDDNWWASYTSAWIWHYNGRIATWSRTSSIFEWDFKLPRFSTWNIKKNGWNYLFII